MKFAVIDVDDVILDWTTKFREVNDIDEERYALPFYGFNKPEFDQAVSDFNSSVHFGCLNATSLIHMCLNRSYHIKFLSSCGDDETTFFFRLNNLKRFIAWDDDKFSLECLSLHGSKYDFYKRHKDDILFVIDDAWRNCLDSASLGLHTIQMIRPARVLEDWESEWYHVGEYHPSIISML